MSKKQYTFSLVQSVPDVQKNHFNCAQLSTEGAKKHVVSFGNKLDKYILDTIRTGQKKCLNINE